MARSRRVSTGCPVLPGLSVTHTRARLGEASLHWLASLSFRQTGAGGSSRNDPELPPGIAGAPGRRRLWPMLVHRSFRLLMSVAITVLLAACAHVIDRTAMRWCSRCKQMKARPVVGRQATWCSLCHADWEARRSTPEARAKLCQALRCQGQEDDRLLGVDRGEVRSRLRLHRR